MEIVLFVLLLFCQVLLVRPVARGRPANPDRVQVHRRGKNQNPFVFAAILQNVCTPQREPREMHDVCPLSLRGTAAHNFFGPAEGTCSPVIG